MSAPQLYGKLVLPLDDNAASPSIQMGGGVVTSSGTGIRGDSANIKMSVGGTDVVTIDSTGITGKVNNILVLTSAASSGGGATEALTVTGLLTTDTILSVSQKTKGANSLPLLGFSTQATNALTGIWSADPGVGAVIIVCIKR